MTANVPITYNSPTNFQIGQQPPVGIQDPVVQAALVQVYKAIQQLIMITSPGNSGGQTISAIASEAITFGAACQLWLNGSTLNVRNANSSAAKPCYGFCTSPAGIASGKTGFIDLGPTVVTIPSATLTICAPYWLAPNAGGIQTTADTTAGHIEQFVGIALTATTILVKPGSWIQH